MSWWDFWRDWLKGDPWKGIELNPSPLKDWEPGKLAFLPNLPPTQAECSEAPAGASSHGSAHAATPSI